jgi:arylsulfatase A-like enzyme/Tfp pilus assembly protein PilF
MVNMKGGPSVVSDRHNPRISLFILITVLLLFIMVLALFLTRYYTVPPPNVLLITVDTLRADRLGCYGYPLARTPNIDALAVEGVLYRNAIASAPITLPSHGTIMTGLYPPAHGVRDNGTYALGDEAVTLAERLKSAGYTTQAFVSALVLNRRYNLSQGFDGYDDELWAEDAPKLFMIRDRPAGRTVDRAINWFKKWRGSDRRKPFFIWVHLFDPHQPYHPPTWARIITPTAYDAEIAFVDKELGRLFHTFKEHGILDNTLVVFTADHGESLGEHQEKTHAVFIYDATVRVPLIIRYPRVFPKGKIYDGPARSVDIVPTVLSVLELPGGKETQGIDLVPVTLGRDPHPDRPQYSESLLSEVGFGMAPLYGVRKGVYKWIRAPKPELYDLRTDPKELRNLYLIETERAAALDKDLEDIFEESRQFSVATRDNPMARETTEMLQSLGYLQGSQERESMGGMDPKDGIVIYNKLEEARHLAQAGNWSVSEALLREILEVIPKHISARNILALILIKQGRLDEAKDQYLRSLADDPQQSRVYAMLGNIALLEGNLEEATGSFHKALRITPQFVEAVSNLGLVEVLRGNEKGARKWYDTAVTIDPTFPHAYRRVADIYYERKDFQQALAYYRKALDRLPNDFRSLIQAGNSARRIGNETQAAAYYRKAQDLRPDSWIPGYNLACLRATQGNAEEALNLLHQAVDKGLTKVDIIARDEDLASVRRLPEFPSLLAYIRLQAETPN